MFRCCYQVTYFSFLFGGEADSSIPHHFFLSVGTIPGSSLHLLLLFHRDPGLTLAVTIELQDYGTS